MTDAADPHVTPFTWTCESGVKVAGEFGRGPHGLVISRMEISAGTTNGVTASMLRKIPVGAILAEQLAKAAEAIPARMPGPPPAGACLRRPGRAPLAPELLRNVAIGYIEENGQGSPPGAMKRLAARFDKPEETIRNWVTRARRDGWLGPSVKGRAGAEPGPRLTVGELAGVVAGGSPALSVPAETMPVSGRQEQEP